ncbi:MAG: hypothetical protein KAW09_08160 [Thermoplasmata archaeon]|nr:hypothetical protein [Thermoplasmata archaeon]
MILSVIVWGTSSAVIVAYFFFSAFFPEFSPFGGGDVGTATLVIPAFCGFLMGLVMNEYDMKEIIYASFVLTVLSLVLIYVTLFFPMITGTATDVGQLASVEEQRQAIVLYAMFILPVSVIGGVLGNAFGASYLPSDEERALRRMLAKDTQKWHYMLQSYLRERARKDKEERKETEEEPSDED